jgi:hypothetical protein
MTAKWNLKQPVFIATLVCIAIGTTRLATAQQATSQPQSAPASQPQSAPASQPQAPGPRIVLSQNAWDFGEVWHPLSPVLKLGVKNEGTADLTIGRVKTTCGCTLASAGKSQLKPGESTEIRVEFETRGKQERVTSKVLIDSNDVERPHIEFPVSGFVKRAVIREPLGGLVIRTLSTAPGQTGSLRLKNQTDQPLKLKLLAKNIDELDVEIKEDKPGQEYTLIGRTTKAVRNGTTRGQFLFSTGLEREEKLYVDVRIGVLPYVEPIPPAILLDPADPNMAAKPVQRTVLLQYYGSTPQFRITAAECKNPDVKVTFGGLLPASGGMEQLLPKMTGYVRAEVTVPPARELPAEGLVIEFQTNDPDHPKAEVLVTKDRAAWELRTYGPSPLPLKE